MHSVDHTHPGVPLISALALTHTRPRLAACWPSKIEFSHIVQDIDSERTLLQRQPKPPGRVVSRELWDTSHWPGENHNQHHLLAYMKALQSLYPRQVCRALELQPTLPQMGGQRNPIQFDTRQ